MKNEVTLRPSYWASVSGGKDSLYMLNLILHNLNKYPLNGVCHFELEIDYPFIHEVIDYMESECKRFGIPFMRIKPRKTWEEIFYSRFKEGKNAGHIQGFPTRTVRWCSYTYKADANKQLQSWLKELGFFTVWYIGFCADETHRFKENKVKKGIERYPLAENGITEDVIWEWAKTQPIFNHFYETQRRCGCMYCSMSSYMNFAYLYKYYPENFDYMIGKMRETEVMRERELGRPFSCISSNPKYNADYLVHIIETKWLKLLNDKELANKEARSKWVDELLEDV